MHRGHRCRPRQGCPDRLLDGARWRADDAALGPYSSGASDGFVGLNVEYPPAPRKVCCADVSAPGNRLSSIRDCLRRCRGILESAYSPAATCLAAVWRSDAMVRLTPLLRCRAGVEMPRPVPSPTSERRRALVRLRSDGCLARAESGGRRRPTGRGHFLGFVAVAEPQRGDG